MLTAAEIIPTADEKMIDFAFLELLIVDQSFRQWVCDRVLGGKHELVTARHSVNETSSGETDIESVWRDEEGGHVAVLVENKVYAPFMPNQLERYQVRAQDGILAGRWSGSVVVLLAPRKYLENISPVEADFTDATISHEDVLEWLKAQDRPDLAFKIMLMERSVFFSKKGYMKLADTAMNDFWRACWKRTKGQAGTIRMDEPGIKGKNSSWMDFRAPWEAPKCKIYYKFQKGTVELVVKTRNSAALAEALYPLLSPDMVVVPKASEVAVEIKAPVINHHRVFSSLEPDLLIADAGLLELYALSVSRGYREAVALANRLQTA
jgi:hypothetical protein